MLFLKIKRFLLNSGLHKYFKKIQFLVFDVIELFNKIKNYNFNWKKNYNEYKISFCTTCKNRAYDLKETYLKNIEDNSYYKNCEFILINYNSEDDLDKWVKKNLKKYIKNGKVKYYKNNTLKKFMMGHAKNCSHKFATGDILVNLDADNLTGKGFAKYVNDIFNKYRKVIVVTNTSNGANGRVCVRKEDFYSVNGYDERFDYGWDEADFVWRIKKKNALFKYRIKNKYFLNFFNYFDNLKKQKNVNLEKSKKESQERHERFLKNTRIYVSNKKNNKLISNKSGFGKGNFKQIKF
jgi:cellulose synthase/poly-beta-1,6-N-acetylglucosamine synthase-like glycosyltransferase